MKSIQSLSKIYCSCIFLIFLFGSSSVSASETSQDAILLNDSSNQFVVYDKLYWLEDEKNAVDFATASSTNGNLLFHLNTSKEAPNSGFTNSSFWFRFKVKNNPKQKKILVEIPYPFLNKLELYVPDYRGVYQCKIVGDHFPFSKREIQHKNFLFEIEFWGNEQKTIYAHILCNGEATSFPIHIITVLELDSRDYAEQITLGIYYGILLFAVFLSVFLWRSLREKVNYYYLLYILGIGVFQLSLDGLAFQFLWPNNTWLANHIIPMAGSFAVFFLLVFTQQLLFTKKYAPKLHIVLWGIALLDVALFCLSLFNNPYYSLSLKTLNLVALLANLTVLISAIVVNDKKYAPARYFLIAFSLLVIGVFISLMKNFGFFPRIFITEYGIQMGSAIEIVFLSFAIAERVKTLKDEKELVQEVLLEQLRENNKSQREITIELEKKVKSRTYEIENQNKVIEGKNKDITDSINYAKRIQDAILPRDTMDQVGAHNMFIYFKPRDIVSGDFYWHTEKDKKVIIATVDCTGHGVPGAFMSMIGSTLLNKVVIDMGITAPSSILKEMDLNIVEALKQKVEISANRDGMDMALCTVDYNKRELVFCGASRPLYLVRNKELYEYKGTSFSIGGFLPGNEKNFEDTVIPFQTNDMVYTFSDGYVDQFGGEKNKKFMSKNLRQLFMEIANLSVEEQKQKVHEKLISWMGNYKQIDDILVIGIRL